MGLGIGLRHLYVVWENIENRLTDTVSEEDILIRVEGNIFSHNPDEEGLYFNMID